jgi:hypothetical protein
MSIWVKLKEPKSAPADKNGKFLPTSAVKQVDQGFNLCTTIGIDQFGRFALVFPSLAYTETFSANTQTLSKN